MKRVPAPRCSFPSCKRPTRDSGGRCTYHRPEGSVPTDGSWASGFGLIHPTGGYDEVGKHGDYTSYLRNGVHHRLDGPARLRHKDGFVGFSSSRKGPGGKPGKNLVLEEWFVEGKLHRLDGPARTRWDLLGETKQQVAYFVHGQLHRIDGPAKTEWWGGRVRSKTFAFEGMKIPEENFAATIEALDSGAPLEWAIAFGAGAVQS